MKHNRITFLGCMIVAISLLSSCNNKETTTPTRKNIEDAVLKFSPSTNIREMPRIWTIRRA